MRIGIPKASKIQEHRVPLTPGSVSELTQNGHQVHIEHNAGRDIGFTNADYKKSGAIIEKSARKIFDDSDLILKVKEPSKTQIAWLSPGQTVFSYLHLAAEPEIAELLLKSGATAIAFETVEDQNRKLPLLAPMSEIAGRMSIQAGAHSLQMESGGRGTLLAGATGVLPGKVIVIGGGVAGENAARIALGFGADVTIIDIDPDRLRQLGTQYGARLKTLYSTAENIERSVTGADLVVGAVLVTGARAPKLVSRELVSRMKPGAVIVDIAIDQGGIAETSRPTTHDVPTYIDEGVVHYCVTNMPGAVARTASLALNNAIFPHLRTLADLGIDNALRAEAGLRAGLNIYRGSVTHPAVAKALGKKYRTPAKALGKPEIHEVA